MALFTWQQGLKTVRAAIAGTTHRRRIRTAARCRLRLGVLEDRVSPAVITVTSLTDDTLANLAGDGQVSLREAIQAANTDSSIDGSSVGSGADTVVFDPSLAGQTITLTANDSNLAFGPTALVISSDVTIDGATGGITLSGNNTHRVFAVASAAALTLQSLTITNGKAQGGEGGNVAAGGTAGGGGAGLGGAVFNAGSLNLVASTLTGNTAIGGNGGRDFGGPIIGEAGGGSAGFKGGDVSGSANAGGGGAGIGGPGGNNNSGSGGLGGANEFGVQAVVGAAGTAGGGGGGGASGTALSSGGFGGGGGGGGSGGFGGGGGGGASGGFGGGGGGGINGVGTGSGGFGGGAGGIYGEGGGGGGLGGAIFNNGGSFTSTNSTLTGNTAQGGFGGGGGFGVGGPGPGLGGAVFSRNGTIKIVNSTISANTAGQGGRGVYIVGDGGAAVATLNNTIVGQSDTGVSDFMAATINGGTASGGGSNNLIRTQTGFTGGFISADPLLAFVAKNGGPTQTLALLTGSPAINAGSNALAIDAQSQPLTTDQRGVNRIYATTVDIGSLEDVGTPSATATSPDITTGGATSYEFTVTYTDSNSTNPGVKVSSVIGNDAAVQVTGPGGFDVLATYVGIDDETDGTPRTATYSIAAPDGSWDGPDFGSYAVLMQSDKVKDLEGNFVPARQIGSFAVRFSLVVTSDADSGAGSLRDTITQANTDSLDDTIVFSPTFFNTHRDISLLTALPQVSNSGGGLTITGPGADNLTVRRDPGSPVFRVFDSLAPTLTMTGFTVSGGRTATEQDGGGLRAGGTVRLDAMAFTGNTSARSGGAIGMNANSFLQVRNSTIAGNTAGVGGGGIAWVPLGRGLLVVEKSTISGNTALCQPRGLGGGPGVYGGGGIYFSGYSSYSPPAGFTAGTVVVRNSTVANNSSSGSGGGIFIDGFKGTLLVQNSTISGNTAAATGQFLANQYPGGYVPYGGGGIKRNSLQGTFEIVNSVVAGNTNGNIPDIGSRGTVNSNFSAIGSTAGIALNGSNNLLGQNLKLGALQNNGGPTLTMRPQVGSPLIHAGSIGLVPPGLTSDQRGGTLKRVFGTTVDIGSFEVQEFEVLPKQPYMFTDADGDLVTIKLTPAVGSGRLLGYLTDSGGDVGTGPIQSIVLSGTDPEKTTLNVTIKRPRFPAVSDGLVSVGAVTGTGLKSLNLAKATLDGPGINLTGMVQSVKLDSISGGADIIAVGSIPQKSTRISVKNGIGDGTTIKLDAPLSRLTAASFGDTFGDGLIDVPSIGTMSIRGNFTGDIKVSGVGIDPVKGKAIRSLKVSGIVNNSDILVGSNTGLVSGNIGTVSVGDFKNSRLFANYFGDNTGTTAGGFNLGAPATITSFRTTRSLKFGTTGLFENSSIIASKLGTATLTNVNFDNGANGEFGVFVNSFRTVSLRATKQTLRNSAPFSNDAFSIEIIV